AVVVVVGAPERVHAVGSQRHIACGVGGGSAQCGLERDGAPLDVSFVADLHVPARYAGVATHGAPVRFRRAVVLQHGGDDKGGEVARLRVGAGLKAAEVVFGNLDGGLRHQRLGRLLQ